MSFKSKRWKFIFLLIPILMVFGIIESKIDSKSSKDGIYYLVVENQATKKASLDKTSWIKVEGTTLTINENGTETSYKYDVDKKEFEKDSMTYVCLFNSGILTIATNDESVEFITYVSPKSKMYSGYEDGSVEITK